VEAEVFAGFAGDGPAAFVDVVVMVVAEQGHLRGFGCRSDANMCSTLRREDVVDQPKLGLWTTS
jgi:hypothetical protein